MKRKNPNSLFLHFKYFEIFYYFKYKYLIEKLRRSAEVSKQTHYKSRNYLLQLKNESY